MYVCICNNKTEKEIKKIIEEKPDISVKEFRAFDVCNQCYKCAYQIQEILEEIRYQDA